MRTLLTLTTLCLCLSSIAKAEDSDYIFNVEDNSPALQEQEDFGTPERLTASEPTDTIAVPPPVNLDEPPKKEDPIQKFSDVKKEAKPKKADGPKSDVTIFFEKDQKELERERYEKQKLKEFYEMERKKKMKGAKRSPSN